MRKIGPLLAALLKGTGTNDAAVAGYIGEFVSSTVLVGSAVSLTTATNADVTSISLTAGDWDVWGQVGFSPAATTTQTIIIAWVNDTSVTLPTAPGYTFLGLPFTTGVGSIIPVPKRRFSLASTTTIYLGARSSFAVDTNAAYGSIFARRVR